MVGAAEINQSLGSATHALPKQLLLNEAFELTPQFLSRVYFEFSIYI